MSLSIEGMVEVHQFSSGLQVKRRIRWKITTFRAARPSCVREEDVEGVAKRLFPRFPGRVAGLGPLQRGSAASCGDAKGASCRL